MEYTEMKDRIAHIIRAKNLTAAEFATQLGIQPSGISHLLSGRNNPSLDFVKRLKETFPEYSLDWVVMGKGAMTVSEPFAEPRSQSESQSIGAVAQELGQEEINTPWLLTEVSSVQDASLLKSSEKARLQQIVFVYDDNTFEVFRPR